MVDLRRLLTEIGAAPRPAGSAAEAAARSRCAALLEGAGFSVRDVPFTYSAFPGRWGTPVIGLLSIGTLLGAGRLGAASAPGSALLLLVGVLLPLVAAAGWMARRGVLDAPLLRRAGTNLEATRIGRPPRVWLLAHLDSKSQPVPIAVRALGVTLTGVVWLAALVLGVAQLLGAVAGDAWSWVAGLGLLAGLPLVLTTVGARSQGALDNASGVTVVVGAALALPADAAVGVLLTSAEELGLAGARAWARAREGGVAINVDGVDDVGRVTLMFSGPAPRRVIEAFAGEAVARRLVPGILTDGVALADAGWEAVTVSRGGWTSLLRVHRPADDLLHLHGDRLDETARIVAEATRRLLTYRAVAEGER